MKRTCVASGMQSYRSMIDNAVYVNAPRIAELVNDELRKSNRIDVESVIDEVINKALEKGLA